MIKLSPIESDLINATTYLERTDSVSDRLIKYKMSVRSRVYDCVYDICLLNELKKNVWHYQVDVRDSGCRLDQKWDISEEDTTNPSNSKIKINEIPVTVLNALSLAITAIIPRGVWIPESVISLKGYLNSHYRSRDGVPDTEFIIMQTMKNDNTKISVSVHDTPTSRNALKEINDQFDSIESSDCRIVAWMIPAFGYYIPSK